MSPFEALYGRKCRTPLYWDQTGERQLFGPEIIQEAEEQVQQIRENLRTAQSRQKSYAEYPIKILDTLTRVTRNKVIKMCKVQWSHHGEDEATWEREEELRIDFPHLFPRSS
jgi:mannose-1-phosphate guanylyltransferase